MALSGESSDVNLEGFTWLLSATLQISRVAGPHIRAIEVVGEDLLEILPAINCVSQQVVEAGPSGVGWVNGEKLDDEEVIIHPTHPAREMIVF
jgi:hypothetical protein